MKSNSHPVRPANIAPLESRETFNTFVYTPWEEAVAENERRQNDPALDNYLARGLPMGVPPIMEGKRSIALFRHVATPNYEITRFAMCADALSQFQPLLLEYTADKFNDRNEGKYYLGKLRFHKGTNKLREPIFEHLVIMNFNESNNVPISQVRTHWGQGLVDFHHALFKEQFPHLADTVYDLSDWLHAIGPTAKEYYKSFFMLFLKHGILFENFLIDGKEYGFTSEVIVPALKQIRDESGYTPLIVALEPTEIEGDHFWHSHPFTRKAQVEMQRSVHNPI